MSAKTIYTRVDIMHDMVHSYGLHLSYGKAWRACERALEEVMGDHALVYCSFKRAIWVQQQNLKLIRMFMSLGGFNQRVGILQANSC